MKHLYFVTLVFCFPLFVQAQKHTASLVFTSDIDHFWTAYDSTQITTDTLRQRQFIQKLYIDKGTAGLKAFMEAREYDAKLWVELINKCPRFWASIRKNTLRVKSQAGPIEASIARFRKLYPEMRPARMYFTVGGLRSGGTTTDDMVLIGTEIATADPSTDASELSDWLKKAFKNQSGSNLVSLNVHEYVHTQQKSGNNTTLLGQSLEEGAADFIAELATETKNNNVYMVYGRAHEAELKARFELEMFSGDTGDWLYNGSNFPHADLGYFMGYAICSAYYRNAADKSGAVKNIIELDYASEPQVLDFLVKSRYYPEPLNKQELLKKRETLLPFIVSLSPEVNQKQQVPAALTELTFNFSEPMDKGVSIKTGEGGKEHFPISGVTGYSEDHKTFKIKLSLQAGKMYDFVITGQGFRSQKGYPLKEYKVHFETK